MAKELNDLKQLLIDTVKTGKKAIQDEQNAPIKLFDYFSDIKENLEKIEELNKNNNMFEQADDQEKEEFTETLGKFLAYTEKHRLNETSPLHPMFNHEQNLMILAQLDKRYEKLKG